jgi:hypothetical protein
VIPCDSEYSLIFRNSGIQIYQGIQGKCLWLFVHFLHRQESAIVYQNITNPNAHGNPMESITQETQDTLQLLSTHFQQIYPSLLFHESIIYVSFSWYHFACAHCIVLM